MKNLGAIQSSIESGCCTLTRCWRIERKDGYILGFTSFPSDLFIDGLKYRSIYGFSSGAIAQSLDSSAVAIELESIFNDCGIRASELISGDYDYCDVQIFLVDYKNLPPTLEEDPLEHLVLLVGTLGKISYSDSTFKAEILSRGIFFESKPTLATSSTCRYRFGDARCGVDISLHTLELTVQSASGKSLLIDSISDFRDDQFSGSEIFWVLGDNRCQKGLVLKSINKTLYLYASPQFTVNSGDKLTITKNCNKSEADCYRYQNHLNFGGEPKMPGLDAYYSGEEQ